ncbi:MAG: hypothetical protein MKZ93_03285, partial [Prochlorococcus sp. ALOHA_A2.0_51]|nr:hypothetical protein [Prochlorococcus sp. ALOHA_A2.0_51]
IPTSSLSIGWPKSSVQNLTGITKAKIPPRTSKPAENLNSRKLRLIELSGSNSFLTLKQANTERQNSYTSSENDSTHPKDKRVAKLSPSTKIIT